MIRTQQTLIFVVAISIAAIATAGTVAVGTADRERATVGYISDDGAWAASHEYGKNQVEYYMTDEEKSYVRPGLTVEVVGVEIPADRHAVVELTFVDDMGMPLDRAGVLTPGPISMSFVFAWFDGERREYTAYTTRVQQSPITGDSAEQATSDSGGTWADLELGRATYRFGTQLPEDFDETKTHTVYVYATRDTEDIVGKVYYSDPAYDFRPDGEDVTEFWAAADDETCNSCHDDLALHGGRRRLIKGCVTCHNSGSTDPDTGNTVDFKVMVHKIHMGANLPSVQAGIPYQIIGYRQSVHDYSDVHMPQDIRNCANCHNPDLPQGHNWFTYPTRASCGSCHDAIDWVTGEGHAAGPADSDDFCSACHQPEGNREFDASVKGSHTIPEKSSQLAGLNMEILDVQNTAPGEFPTVTFRVFDDSGAFVDPSSLDRIRLRWGGPTVEYVDDFQEDALDATIEGDVAVKTLTTPIADDATGSVVFTADCYRFVTIDDGTADGISVREAAYNPVFFAPVTDGEAVARRRVVDMDRCNVCHDRLALHGGQRLAMDACLLCHRPNETDAGDRPDDQEPNESVHFKYMIHKIHTGKGLVLDYTVYGFGSRPHNYNDVRYPGDLRNCMACHESGTYGMPLPDEALETPTERDWYTPMQPGAAACLSCHGTEHAAAHAWTNTAPFGESCASCHGDDRAFSVDFVHAR
jgi:OmcA/MtrC family decaheme c-type cytochrome